MKRMRIILLLAIISIVMCTGMVIANSTSTYTDVPAGAWYTPYLNLDYLSGYPDGTFRPYTFITRAEFAKIVISAIGESSSTGTSSFTDVPDYCWARGYIERAKELGIIDGYPGDLSLFKPKDYVTRHEAAKILVLANESTLTAYRGEFSDVSSSLWSALYIQAAKDSGMISGYPDGTFRPLAQTSRAEAAKMVYVMVNGTTTPSPIEPSTIVYINKGCACMLYHVDGCQYLTDSKAAITLDEARAQGYEPCSVCNPPR